MQKLSLSSFSSRLTVPLSLQMPFKPSFGSRISGNVPHLWLRRDVRAWRVLAAAARSSRSFFVPGLAQTCEFWRQMGNSRVWKGDCACFHVSPFLTQSGLCLLLLFFFFLWQGRIFVTACLNVCSGVPRNFVRGGSTNSVEDRENADLGVVAP